MITTKSVGIGEETANPKPVRGVNWCGLPIKDGEDYWGPLDRDSERQQEQVQTVVRPRRKAKGTRKAWSPEARAAYSQRMKAWWQAKRNATSEST